MRDIDYCCSCSFYTATLYIERALIFSMHACAAGLRVPCKAGTTKRPRKLGSRAWFEIYWQYVVWSRTVQLCRYYFASTRWGTFPQVCRGTWTLLLDADHKLDDFREFREASTEAAGSYRLVWSRLLDSDTPTEQFIALLDVVRRRSQILPIHAGSTGFVVNVRLTARLQSLLLARCWPACFAFFSSFPLAIPSNINSCKVIVCRVCSGHYHTNELSNCVVAPNC